MFDRVTTDRAGLRVLTRAQCLRLLQGAPVGRIVFTEGALPAVLPVNFTVHDGNVIIRTGPGSTLCAAARNAVVAFEADEYDVIAHTGWSVMVVGQARIVSDPTEHARLRDLCLRPWAPGRRDEFISVPMTMISGRLLGGAPSTDDSPSR